MLAQVRAAVRIDPSGNVVSSKGDAGELSQVAAYAARLAELVGDGLGMQGLVSVEVTQHRSRTLIYKEKTGNTFALSAAPDADLIASAGEARPMSTTASARALSALRDVAGVHGSFVLRPTGELVGKDLPAVFHDELFVEVGARLSRFVETMAADGDEVTLGRAALRRASLVRHALCSRLAGRHHRQRHQRGGAAHGGDAHHAPHRAGARGAADQSAAARRASPSLTPPPVSVAGSHGVPRTYRGRVLTRLTGEGASS